MQERVNNQGKEDTFLPKKHVQAHTYKLEDLNLKIKSINLKIHEKRTYANKFQYENT